MGTDQTVTRRLGQVEYGHEDGESRWRWRWRVQVDIVIFKESTRSVRCLLLVIN